MCIGLPLTLIERFSQTVHSEWAWSSIFNVWHLSYDVTSESLGRVPGLYYASAVFLGLNGISYFVILLCYVEIVRFVFRSSKRVGLNKDMKEQIRLTMKVSVIVLTDFACWSPIVVLGILVQADVVVLPPSVFAWCVTVVLPINSAINPYLYTISSIVRNHLKQKSAPKDQETRI